MPHQGTARKISARGVAVLQLSPVPGSGNPGLYGEKYSIWRDKPLDGSLFVLLLQILILAATILAFRHYLGRMHATTVRISGIRDEMEALASEFGAVSERTITELESRTHELALIRKNQVPDSGKAPSTEQELLLRAALSGSPASDAAFGSPSGGVPVFPGSISLENPVQLQSRSPSRIQQTPAYPRSPRMIALELFKSGFSSEVIAAKTGLSVAEVELIAGLEERRGG